jgi:hypothetical protein
MSYPDSYQEAEHRRALGALLEDLVQAAPSVEEPDSGDDSHDREDQAPPRPAVVVTERGTPQSVN